MKKRTKKREWKPKQREEASRRRKTKPWAPAKLKDPVRLDEGLLPILDDVLDYVGISELTPGRDYI
jgi:hypothetical protein